MRTPTLLALALTACIPAETGIDHTVISGTISIPPATVEDGRTNNDVATPQGLGPDDSTTMTYRSVIVSGKISDWPSGFGNAEGDPDNYAFTAPATETWTFSLTFETEALPVDTGPADTADTADTAAGPASIDADVIELQLVDRATFDAETGAGVVWSGSTDGSGGAFSFEYEVTKGAKYALRVLPSTTDAPSEELPYTLVVSGATPTDGTVLVGAYLGSDPTVKENPVGGTNAVGWSYDPATYTWSGTWKMMWIREVVAVEDTDLEDDRKPLAEVTEAPSPVFVRAAVLTGLNKSPAAGALYTTVPTEVALGEASITLDDPLVLDGIAPKVIGVEVTETLPDTTIAEVDANTVLNVDTLVAQDIGMLSALGYVDVITGSTTFDGSEGWGGGNDSDAYAFTVPDSRYVVMRAEWPDSTADIDLGIFYDDPDYGYIDLMAYGDTWCMTGADPEVCESVITLEPDTTYWVVPLGYLGTDEQPYTIELEWVAP